MNIFEEYKLAVDSHNSLNSELQSLFEQLAEAKTLYILPITDKIAAVEKDLNAARSVYAEKQEALHNAVVFGNIQSTYTLQ